MATEPNVLVVAVVGEGGWRIQIEKLCQELCDQLAGESSVTLAVRNPVDPERAARIARRSRPPPVILLVGEKDRLAEAAAALLPLSGNVAPIPVVFDEGTASLTVRRAGPEQVLRLVRAAVDSIGRGGGEGDEGRNSGEVIDIGVRRHGDRRKPPRKEPGGEKPPEWLLPAEPAADLPDGRALSAALAWAEAATAVLTDLWSSSAEGSAVYGLSWHELLASLDRLDAIEDAPMGEAAERFDLVRAMLADPAAQDTPLAKLARLLGGDELALKLVMLVLAPELDIRFQRLFGALHDDMGRRYVSMGLACAILAAATEGATPKSIRAELSALAELRDFRIVEGMGDTMPAADEPLRIDPRLLDWLVSGREAWLAADPAFEAILRHAPYDALALLPEGRRAEVEDAVESLGDRDGFACLVLTGSERGWIEVEALALAPAELRIAPPAAEQAAETLGRVLREAIRKARLLDRQLVVDMIEPGPQAESFWRAFASLFALCRPAPVVLAANPAWLLSLVSDEAIAVLPLPPVAQYWRVEAIEAALAADGAPDPDLAAELAERFRVPLAALPGVPPLARAEATKARLLSPGDVEWRAAFRSAAGSRLPTLARRVPPRAEPETGSQLDRVVLPQRQRRQLETLVNHVRVGGRVLRDWSFGDLLDARGVSALFTGESGTGKTTAAHAIASALGTDLYVIDLARMVSKYIGETEKNLDIVFTEAERAGAVLLFDEADALFGKRSAVSDSHDRYANIEVAYLLQRMELFDGLAILTTNHPRNLDPAFGRRLRFTVDFPFPGPADRQLIWERILPPGSPHRWPGIDFTLAARRLEVNGGSIRQIVLHALMAAAETEDGVVRAGQLQEATRTELMRLGKHDKIEMVGDLFSAPVETRAA